MPETEEIIFDDKSGISIEEQREILFKINKIAEKNRRSLSQGSSGEESGKGETAAINAKKTGAFFPMAVNITAIIALCAGAFLLVFFNGKVDAQVRRGTAVFNLTERALIEDIRRDTAEKISAKEKEISLISSRLDEVNSQLSYFYPGNQILSPEQLSEQERLLSMQNSYRTELAVLHEERSQILENSRSREARLRAQLEEREREFAAPDSAAGELEMMTNEKEAVAAIDAQLSGGLASAGELVKRGEYERAAGLIETLRDFCNNNTYAFSRSFQERREFYNQSLYFLETMITDGAGKSFSQGAGSQEQSLAAKNAELEETIAGLRVTIDAFNSDGSAQARRLGELEEAVSSLRAQVSSLETRAAEKDRNIASLESDKTELTRTVSARDNTIRDLQSANAAHEQEIASLRNRINNILQAAQE
jgi:predicted RNase H-like nuclease (RuvC/YqgF family)